QTPWIHSLRVGRGLSNRCEDGSSTASPRTIQLTIGTRSVIRAGTDRPLRLTSRLTHRRALPPRLRERCVFHRSGARYRRDQLRGLHLRTDDRIVTQKTSVSLALFLRFVSVPDACGR